MKKMFALAAVALAVAAAHAQDFPAGKPVTIVVPFRGRRPDRPRGARPGRSAAQAPGRRSVIIDNVPGAGSSIGAAKVARANPDGYTLLLNHIAMATVPTLVRNVPFKVESDFEYLGIVNDVPMTLISKPSLPAANYKALSTWIAANKGKINIGNAGVGSASHLCGLLFQSATKTEMTPVPYKGTAPAITDLIGGQIDLLCDQSTNTSPQIEARRSRPCCDHAQAPDHAAAERPADAGRSRPEELPGHDLARPVCAQGHAGAGAQEAQRCAEGGAERPGLHQARRAAGCRRRDRWPHRTSGPQEVRGG
jgi:tripartite-type tricarboxylate transporter receptor subunit TctC